MFIAETTAAKIRRLTAGVWLMAAFFQLPLAWLRLSGRSVPLFGSAQLVTLPALTVLAVAAIIISGRAGELYRSRRWQIFGYVQALAGGVATAQWWCGNVVFESYLTLLFYLLAPVAAAALRKEILAVLPFIAASGAGLLIWSGAMSQHFTGLTGNWNWTQGMIFALLPAVAVAFDQQQWRLGALVLSGVMLVVLKIFYPAQLSYAAIAAMVAAAAVWYVFKRLDPARRRVYWSAAIAGILLFTLFMPVIFGNDSRFLLWRGTWQLISGNFIAGAGDFAGNIREVLPEAYFFSPFAAELNTHAHNELLSQFAAIGIAGVIYWGMLAFMVLDAPAVSRTEQAAKWMFLVLFFAGMFDLHCAGVPGALWMLSCAGVISGGSAAESVEPPLSYRRLGAAAAAAIVAVTAMAVNFRSGLALRRGELALLDGNQAAAQRELLDSLRRRKTPANLYAAAELETVGFEPYAALKHLDALHRIHRSYRHSRRLAALNYFAIGEREQALQNIYTECRLHPLSIVSARLKLQMLKQSGAAPAAIAVADEELQRLCFLKNITIGQAEKLTDIQENSISRDRSAAGWLGDRRGNGK